MRHILLRTYFQVRPTFPRTLRIPLRRLLAKRSIHRFSGHWPINELASREPDWWTGWPGGRKFAFVLTHDVEGKRGLERCRRLAAMEMSLGFRSSFNFVPEGEYETPQPLREFLSAHGFEVGVHDLRHDGKLFGSEKKFRRDAQRINHYLADWGSSGFRSGFMLHNFDWLRDLNIAYDASGFDTDPFEPQPDGTNTIFPFWVGRSDDAGYVELPYTLPQDSTLFLLLRESGIGTWVRKLDWIAQHGGMALVNAHPDYMGFEGTRHPSEYGAELYGDFLEYVAYRYQQEAWYALPREVAAYMRQVRDVRIRAESCSSCGNNRKAPQPRHIDGGTPVALSTSHAPSGPDLADPLDWRLQGKRVAMVMFSFYPSDPRPRRAAETLASKGMKVDLICLEEKPSSLRHEIVNGIDVLRIPIRHRRGSIFRYVFEYGAFLLTSAAILTLRSLTHGYDLVYVHNMPDILALSGIVPKLCGAKVILDLHDPMPELMTTIFGFRPDALVVRLLKWFEVRSIAFSDSVVTVNRACARLFTSRGCPLQKMHVVMNSPDERIFQPRTPRVQTGRIGPEYKKFVIMYHGSIVERNGLDLAVQAFALLQKSIPDAELRIYGKHTPFLDTVMRSLGNEEWKESVCYLGPKSLEELVPAIEDCNVGIIPNRWSIFTELNTPTRIFEYLALGKPVIAPEAPGIRDYFDDGTLVFFKLGDAVDLAEKIEYVHAHPQEATEIAWRGQAVYQEHRWAQERQRLTTVVARLLDVKVAESDSEEHILCSRQKAVL